MRQAAEFLACIPARSEGLNVRPVGSDQYILEVTVTREHLSGLNSPEQNCLTRAVKSKERMVLAALGFREGELAIAAGNSKGVLAVLDKDRRVLESHPFDLPAEWSDLMGLIDLGSPIDKAFRLDMVLVLTRPKDVVRVRQTTVEDVKRFS